MIIIVLLINLAALIIILRHGLPEPFPWHASTLLAIVLLLGGLRSPFAGIERGVGFVTLLSSVVITWYSMRWLDMDKVKYLLYALSILLTVFILADAFRLIQTSDIVMSSGETFGLIRRPYLFEHPNLKACWLLLLSLSPISLIGIIFAQSRGALMGYIAAFFRFVPKRFYIHALVLGSITIIAAAFIRPGSFLARLDFWHDGISMFLSQPLFGHGTGTYGEIAKNGMDTAHNAALTIAAENGLTGLIAFVLWVSITGAHILRSSNAMKYNIIAFSVQQMVDDQWLHPITAILVGMVISITIFQFRKTDYLTRIEQ